MADVKGLINDPDFQKLDSASQKEAISRLDPDIGKLSDEDFTTFSQRMKNPPGVMERAMTNLPRSLANSAMRLVRGPSMGEGGMVQRDPNAPPRPDRGALGNLWENTPLLSHPVNTLKEAFAEDPVSVAQVPLTLAARGGMAAIPAEAKAGLRGAGSAVTAEAPNLVERIPLVGKFARGAMELGPKVMEGARRGIEEFRKAQPPEIPEARPTAPASQPQNFRAKPVRPFSPTPAVESRFEFPPEEERAVKETAPASTPQSFRPTRPPSSPNKGIVPLSTLRPALRPVEITPEQLGVHGGVENTPMGKPAHPPFAEGAPFSPSKVARQLRNVGTMAEGVERPTAPVDTLLERLKETGALPIAKKLRTAMKEK